MSITVTPKLAGLGAVAMIAAVGSAIIATSASATTPTASTATTSSVRHIQKVGTAAYKPVSTGSGAPASVSTEIPKAFGPEAQGAAAGSVSGLSANRSMAPRGAARAAKARAGAVTVPGGVIRNGPRLLASFDGLNHRDQRTANGGNQFSVEPPDQGLCVGGGHVVEALNTVFRVFNTDGSGQTGVVDLNTFFGYPAQIDRTTGVTGPFVTDPSCLYDPSTGSFFLTILTLEQTPDGNFTGDNHLDIAVTTNPTGSWNIYRLDVTDDGSAGTPVHPHCPCLGDYPHIGVDANGFYLTTNEYSFFGTEFNSAQIYAFAKHALARGDTDVLVTQLDTTAADQGRNGFTIWPAQSPTTGDYNRDNNGTAFFLSSNAAEEATGTQDYTSHTIVTWSLTNTRSLNTTNPDPRLHHTRVGVTTYTLPPAANQKPGPFPLGQCLNDTACATFLLGAPDPHAPNTEYALDSNDTRMQQVTYTGGNLYGALDTAVHTAATTKAGIAWYIVRPQSHPHSVTATLVRQGQLALAGNNLTYPAIGVTAQGKGIIAFTLVGDGYYPSAAYTSLDTHHGTGDIFIAKTGLGPADGFSGYQIFNDPNPARPRWGDYGATATTGNTIWIASEYIGQTCTLTQYETTPFGSCNTTRTALANWDTRISLIQP